MSSSLLFPTPPRHRRLEASYPPAAFCPVGPAAPQTACPCCEQRKCSLHKNAWPHPSVRLTIGCSCRIDNDAQPRVGTRCGGRAPGCKAPFARISRLGPFQFTLPHRSLETKNRMPDRNLPPPWSSEEHSAYFVVRDNNGLAVAYVYHDNESEVSVGGQIAN